MWKWLDGNYRSDSSAEWEASANLVVAVFKRSSLRSKSSSSSWTRRLRPATSPSAWIMKPRKKIRFHQSLKDYTGRKVYVSRYKSRWNDKRGKYQFGNQQQPKEMGKIGKISKKEKRRFSRSYRRWKMDLERRGKRWGEMNKNDEIQTREREKEYIK